METSYMIGDLAREHAVTRRTLRFYEDLGLLNPQRRGQHRLYGRRDRARLKLILMGKRVGLSLDQIKEMLDFYELRDGRISQLEAALAKFSSMIEHLHRQKQDVEQAIEELTRTMRTVAGLLKDRVSAEAAQQPAG
jgi:DNA-binding transcriptional MerR regulator